MVYISLGCTSLWGVHLWLCLFGIFKKLIIASSVRSNTPQICTLYRLMKLVMYTLSGVLLQYVFPGMDLSDQYIFCKQVGITSTILFNGESVTPLPSLKKGLILELLKIKRSKGTWPLYRKWIEKLHSNPGSPSVNALRQSVLAVETKSEKI